MRQLGDQELIDELKKRFEEKERALFDLRVMTKKLEALNKKLQDSESVKSHFLSNIKNEINNPLTAILGLAQQLKDADTIDCDYLQSVGYLIFAESFNLDFQLRNIFAAAELESGENSLTLSLVDVNSLILNTVNAFRHQANEKSITIDFVQDWLAETEQELIFKTDPEKLAIIIANMISNAIEFNNKNGKVEVKAIKEDRELSLCIKDNGIGIEPEYHEAIFDRFYQIDSGATKTHRGHGLGLSIVKAMLDLINGNVTLKSTPGKGSDFCLTIPEAESEDGEDIYSSKGNEFLFDDGEVF